MPFVRAVLVVATVLGIATSGATAQDDAQKSKPSSPITSKIDDVSNWTIEKWNKAKAEWAREKEKWAGCQKQAEDKNLTGSESWSFIASCMTS
jgi:hypothetical protein